MAAATLDAVGGVIGRRLKELEPVMQEFRQLEAARDALAKITSPAASSPTRRTSVARAARKRKAAAKRGRPQGSGSRDREVVAALVEAKDGLTVPEIAERIGVKPNYLYRVVKRLKSEGRVMSTTHGHQTRYHHVTGHA